MSKKWFLIVFVLILSFSMHASNESPIFQSKAYSVYPDKVLQDDFVAKVISSTEMTSNYRSSEADRYSPTLNFKFSINSRDNEMMAGRNHIVTLHPINGKCVTEVEFGQQLVREIKDLEKTNLPENTVWTVKLDMRKVIDAFTKQGFYTLYNGDKISKTDFKGVYIAGNSAPLSWDFSNLYQHSEMMLTDADGDGIFEISLTLNSKSNLKLTNSSWKLSHDISAFPQYKSTFPLSDAIYNMATEEMIKAVEPDSTFRTGQEWAGVWTRDISYSIILSMANLQPQVAKYSLLRKVKNNRIIQDTGTGGAYPVSTDRIVWAVAAWELYKSTGDKNWLAQAYNIIKNTIEDDLKNVYDPVTGLVKGESSFLDWREQTYPRWMQPVDIYESENLGTNAVHYQANIILAEMANLLNDKKSEEKYRKLASKIKVGINTYLWQEDKGYYGQYLYGRNFKSLSPRAEALGEALCVWFGIAEGEKLQSVIAKTPITEYGIPCIYPQIPGIPPYHNNGIWPFVQSYWALASAKAGNDQSLMQCISALYRPSALFLTNKENFVAETGDFAGTQINSSNMLWSLSGSLAIVQRILFGLELGVDKLMFKPFVPEALAGKRSLTNFKYRNAVLDIEMEGFGNKIKSFEVDGKISNIAEISAALTGYHSIKIVLANNKSENVVVNEVQNMFSTETPVVSYTNKCLAWEPIEGAVVYQIFRNGTLIAETHATKYKNTAKAYSEYQVLAVDQNNLSSFMSEPLAVGPKLGLKVYELESFAPKSTLSYKNYSGDGFVEVNKDINRNITVPIKVKKSGMYAVTFIYSNGNGPVNTENKCAIRSLAVDNERVGAIVLPQRGNDEWSNWGSSNAIHIFLSKGKHILNISFEPSDENMNGVINQAMLDAMQVCLIE